jgi:hypothetical protein
MKGLVLSCSLILLRFCFDAGDGMYVEAWLMLRLRHLQVSTDFLRVELEAAVKRVCHLYIFFRPTLFDIVVCYGHQKRWRERGVLSDISTFVLLVCLML